MEKETTEQLRLRLLEERLEKLEGRQMWFLTLIVGLAVAYLWTQIQEAATPPVVPPVVQAILSLFQ